MRAPLILVPLAVAMLQFSIEAQSNTFKNGNFESSQSSFAPWTLTNASNTKNARIQRADVGFPETGGDHVFAAGANTGNGGDVGIEQEFEITSALGSGDWWLSAVVTNPNYATDGLTRYTITIDRLSGTTWQTVKSTLRTISTAHGPIQEVLRLELGKHRVRLVARATDVVGADFYIDDCVARPIAKPVPIFESYRNGRDEFLLVNMQSFDARTATILFVSLQRLSTPIRVPGFTGEFELDPFREGGIFQLGIGGSGWTRRFDRLDFAMLGRTLFFQAVEIGPAINLYRFGSRTAWFEQK